MRSDHLNKHQKTHNPQTAKKMKDEKPGKQANGPSTPLVKSEKVKQEKSDPLSPASRLAEERMLYGQNDYQANSVQQAANGELFLQHSHHSFAPILDGASLAGNGLGFTMPYYSWDLCLERCVTC